MGLCLASAALLCYSSTPKLPAGYHLWRRRMLCRAILIIGLLLALAADVRAQSGDLPPPDPAGGVPWRSSMEGFAPPATAVSGPRYVPPVQEHQEPIGETPWCESPYR